MTFEHVLTVIGIILPILTIFTFIQNQIKSSREYGKFLQRMEANVEEIKILKERITSLQTLADKRERSVTEEINVLKNSYGKLEIQLSFIRESLVEIKQIVKEK